MYVTDHDEVWFPARAEASDGLPGVQHWIGYDSLNEPPSGNTLRPAIHSPRAGAIDPYLRSQEIKRCPSMPRSWQIAYALNNFQSDIRAGEYAPSSRTCYPTTLSAPLDVCLPAGDAEVEEPASTVLIWEHNFIVPECNILQFYDWFESPPQNEELREHFTLLHRFKTNTLWADGHARALRYEQWRRPLFSTRKDIYTVP
jgi:prepilin-type processing-associated H-X9-DG protein